MRLAGVQEPQEFCVEGEDEGYVPGLQGPPVKAAVSLDLGVGDRVRARAPAVEIDEPPPDQNPRFGDARRLACAEVAVVPRDQLATETIVGGIRVRHRNEDIFRDVRFHIRLFD